MAQLRNTVWFLFVAWFLSSGCAGSDSPHHIHSQEMPSKPTDRGDHARIPVFAQPADSVIELPPLGNDSTPMVSDSLTGGSGQPMSDSEQLCDERPNKVVGTARPKVFYGTDHPEHVQLTSGQTMAIGNFWGCSGALIKPTWVLTASHCGLSSRAEFCVGPDPDDPYVCVSGTRVFDHPRGDLTLLELESSPLEQLPDIEPISLFTDELTAAWIGRTAEAAGYGRDERGRSGRREFTAEPIVGLYSDTVTIDGEGRHGVCFGDSGGPLFVTTEDGSTRIIGTLSNGDGSCTGRDNFTRIDVYLDWIEQHTGPTVPPGPQPCGEVSNEGVCGRGARSVTYCGADETLKMERCLENQTCSWVSEDSVWRCQASTDDPCRGVTFHGGCSDGVLSWCDRGILRTRDCQACGESCALKDDVTGYLCVESDCGALTYEGRCDDNTAVWCRSNGQLDRRDCSDQGQVCGYVDDQLGYFCMDAGSCGGLDYQGRCEGSTAQWCDGGQRRELNCETDNRVCAYINDDVGHYCTDCDGLDYAGRCDGDVAVWCDGRGQLDTKRCSETGQVCDWVNDELGFYCTDRDE